MRPTKPGHDESTSLMTISSPPVPGGDPSTGVRKRQTSDHRTRPPPRPRRNGGIADPEGFAISWSALVRGGRLFRSDTLSDSFLLLNLNHRRFPRLFRGILTATSAEVSVVLESRLRRVPKPLRSNLDDASLLVVALFEAVHQQLLMGSAENAEVAFDSGIPEGVDADVPKPDFRVVLAALAWNQRARAGRVNSEFEQMLLTRGKEVGYVHLRVGVDGKFRTNDGSTNLLRVHHPEDPTVRVEVLEVRQSKFLGAEPRAKHEGHYESGRRRLPPF